jgi:hypothetical protein
MRNIEYAINPPVPVAMLVPIDVDGGTKLSDLCLQPSTACHPAKIKVWMAVS